MQDLIEDANCYRKVRELRWPEGVRCPFCGGEHRLKQGFDSAPGRCRRTQTSGASRRHCRV
ncbi:transposase [Candidatus Thiosymbion oneisti]|uniref:transposase n=1 Tax=Candidatus Thiosymbion oneisti TaxID=589554 RepID=UPI00114D3B2C